MLNGSKPQASIAVTSSYFQANPALGLVVPRMRTPPASAVDGGEGVLAGAPVRVMVSKTSVEKPACEPTVGCRLTEPANAACSATV